MPNIGTFNQALIVGAPVATIPEGYHNGEGKVTVSNVELSANPTEEQQIIKSDSGAFLTQVTVNAISSTYVGSAINKVSDIQDSYEIIEGSTKQFNAGYYDKGFTVVAKSDTAGDENAFADRTVGTATAEDIAWSKTAWVNGVEVTGTVHDYIEGDPSSSVLLSITGTEESNTITSSAPAGLHRAGVSVSVDLSELEAVLAAI